MDTTEDKLVALISCKLFDTYLRALSLPDVKVRAGSSRTCSILIDGNNPSSKTAIFRRSQANISGDILDGAVRFDLASCWVKILLIRKAH